MSVVPSQPYVAPWQTQFHRYSTQAIAFLSLGPGSERLIIPSLQWWRVASVYCTAVISGVAGVRAYSLTFTTPAAGITYASYAPGLSTAGLSSTVTWMPNSSPFTTDTSTGFVATMGTFPDVLWPPGSILSVAIVNAQAGDDFSQGPKGLIEIYTEDYNNEGAFVLTPTPVLT